MILRGAELCVEGGRVNHCWCMGAVSHSFFVGAGVEMVADRHAGGKLGRVGCMSQDA